MSLTQIIIPRFRVLDQEMAARDDFYRLSPPARDEWRLDRLNQQWRRAVQGTEYYGQLRRQLGLPETFGSLAEFKTLMPLTDKNVVRANPAAFKVNQPSRGKWMATGGSTGIPLKVYWGLTGHLESLRDQYWARLWWGVGPFDRQAMLWGHAQSFGRSLKGRLYKALIPVMDGLRSRKRFSAYSLDPATLRRYYDEMAAYRPSSLYAYASAAHLLALANRGRPPFATPPKAAFLAAEPIRDNYRQSIREVLGCPCAGEYGSIDCGMIAYEHPRGGYRVFERSLIVESVEREDGREIVVTQLRDNSFPLFRYPLGDMTSGPIERNGDGWEELPDVRGRVHDLLKTPSGGVCYGGAITQAIEQISEITLFTILQRRDYSLLISVKTQSGRDLAESQADWLRAQAQRILGEPLPVEIRHVEAIERTAAGKHRYIRSELEDTAPARLG